MQHFTATYKQFRNADNFERELACLKPQFPAILLDPQEGDLFVGRHQLPAIGFAPQEYGAMCGLGYYINFDKIALLKQDQNLNDEDRAVLGELQPEYAATRYPDAATNGDVKSDGDVRGNSRP